jgi:hypothetical protein
VTSHEGLGDDLAVLLVYGVGIALYTLAVAVLYLPMSTRMMFARRFGERRVATPGRRLAYVVFFPFVSFLFFVVVAAAMLFMSSFTAGALEPREILTLAMAIVLAIRVCAYVSEPAAADLARVMPLGLLGVILVNNGFSDFRQSLENLARFAEEPTLLGVYFVVVVVAEFVLRIVYELLGRPGRGRDPRDPVPGLQKRPQA